MKRNMVLLIAFLFMSITSKAQFFDLTEILPKQYVKDGTVNYTDYIQSGINKYTKVLMPNFPVLIDDRGIKLKSNSIVKFQDFSSLKLKPTQKGSYSILQVFDVENVIILNPKIIGDRYNHLGEKGEWGKGIHIYKSKYVKIDSAYVSNCWGDGIYIGPNNEVHNDNISITNSVINNSRRNGVSITDGSNILISNTIINNSVGVAPMAGIDIEPNSSDAVIENISLQNISTKNNGNFGIVISLGQLPSHKKKNVSISIDSHIDYGTKYAFCIASFRGDYENKQKLQGEIKVVNSKWFDNQFLLAIGDYEYGPKIIFKNIESYQSKPSFWGFLFKKKNNINTKGKNKFIETIKKYPNISVE